MFIVWVYNSNDHVVQTHFSGSLRFKALFYDADIHTIFDVAPTAISTVDVNQIGSTQHNWNNDEDRLENNCDGGGIMVKACVTFGYILCVKHDLCLRSFNLAHIKRFKV